MSMFKKEGDQLLFRETGQPARLFFVEQFGFSHFSNEEILKFIDVIANNGGNGIRVFGFFPFGKGREDEPYVRSGTGFDLNRFNDAYFNYLRQWMCHAYKRGIVVLYELFDSVGLKYSQVAQYHPFGQFTQGNLLAFSNLSDHNLVAHQKNYLTKVVNALKQYPNVIFGIMNEFHHDADKHWHYEMSRHVKTLAPNHLISGSEEGSSAMDDPNVDIWAIHTGSYNRGNCTSNAGADIAEWRPHFGGKIITYSTDGFGRAGIPCENPDAMRNLAQDVKDNGLQIFRFLDHKAYVGMDDTGQEYPLGTWVKQAHVYETARVAETTQSSGCNTSTYQEIAEVYQPTPLPRPESSEPPELPKGFLHIFDATYLQSTHPDVVIEKGGKAITATTTQGYLGLSPQITDCPAKPLVVYFSIFTDNNTYDDALILILDVYDAARKEVLINRAVTRKQFPKAQEFNLLKLPFTPSENAKLEFRVYYFGYAYVAFDKMAVTDPSLIKLKAPSEIPDITPGDPCQDVSPKEGIIDILDVITLNSNHPDVFPDKGGKAILATTTQGFLAYGPDATGYPTQALDVYFSVYIDNNTYDDKHILTLDVYDVFQGKTLAEEIITRTTFPVARAFTLFKLSFTPLKKSELQFRINYHGWSYVAADKIAVVDPEKIELNSHADLLALQSPIQTENTIIFESLKDGQSKGEISSGTLTPEGLQFHGGDGYVGYKIPATPRGFVEFSARGFIQDELHGGTEYKGVLLTMWDGIAGYSYENAPFIFEMRKYGFIENRPDASNTLWFKIKSNGQWTENHYHILFWDRDKTYRFRVEWGGGETRVMRDGQIVSTGTYHAEFAPPDHRIQIGANPLRARKTAHDLLISDVVIGRL